MQVKRSAIPSQDHNVHRPRHWRKKENSFFVGLFLFGKSHHGLHKGRHWTLSDGLTIICIILNRQLGLIWCMISPRCETRFGVFLCVCLICSEEGLHRICGRWTESKKGLSRQYERGIFLSAERRYGTQRCVGGESQSLVWALVSSGHFFSFCPLVVVDGQFKDVEIKEGSIFLLPANVPHSPQRKADTVGLVIERRRTPDLIDHLRFYCDGCRELLYEEELVLQTLQIGKALVPPISRFFGDVALRTCKKCGHITDTQVKE